MARYVDLPTCSNAFFSQKFFDENLFSPIIEIVKGAFSHAYVVEFFFLLHKRVPKCCPLRKTSKMFINMLPRSPRKVSQVLNSFLISSQFCLIKAGLYLFAVATLTQRDTFLRIFLFPFKKVSFYLAIMLKPIKESNIVQD